MMFSRKAIHLMSTQPFPFLSNEDPTPESQQTDDQSHPTATAFPATGYDLVFALTVIWGATFTVSAFPAKFHFPDDALSLELILFVLLPWILVCKRQHIAIRNALALHPVSRKAAALYAVAGIIAAVVMRGLIIMASYSHTPMLRVYSVPSLLPWDLLLSTFLVTLTASFSEEIFYRGFAYPILEHKIGSIAAILLIGVWSGLEHLAKSPSCSVLVAYMTIAAAATFLRRSTNSVVPGIIVHFSWNLCALLLWYFPIGLFGQ